MSPSTRNSAGRFRLLLVVLRKELLDASRDRRAISTILFSAIFGPVLVGFMLNRIADRQRVAEDVTIPIVGAEYAPALIDWLKQQAGVTIIPGPHDAEAAVRDRGEDVVVIISPEFSKKFKSALPAEVQIVSDGSRNTSRPKVGRVKSLFSRYSSEIGSMRLVARGVSPAIASAIQVEDIEVSSAQQRAASILNFIPLFIVLAAFTGGMQIATDSTAGERERGSLEPLLVNPAPRSMIVGGKWLAATLASMTGVILTTIFCLAMLNFIPLQDLGIRFRLGGPQIAGILAAVLPMCMLATGIQTYLSTFARSFKEAQSYMGFLMMVPMLPGMMATLYPLTNKPWMYPVPILGQHVLLADVIGGRAPAMMWFAAAAGAALLGAAVLVWLTRALFERERIIFSR